MSIRCTLVLLLSLSASWCAAAEHLPVENGRPCLPEVCVDQDLNSLLDLPWVAVEVPTRPAPPVPALDALRADAPVMDVLAAYWPSHVFDRQGLVALSGVRAVCRDIGVWQRPRAQYISRRGGLVTVIFEPEPKPGSSDVVFRVATIVSHAPPDASDEALEILGHEALRPYDGLSAYASTDGAGVQWQAKGAEGPALILVAPVGDPQQRAAQLAHHPMCLQPPM